jgi:hypothetical protein
MKGFKDPGFRERQEAANKAKQAALDKFRARSSGEGEGTEKPAVASSPAEKQPRKGKVAGAHRSADPSADAEGAAPARKAAPTPNSKTESAGDAKTKPAKPRSGAGKERT